MLLSSILKVIFSCSALVLLSSARAKAWQENKYNNPKTAVVAGG
jgi:hypothetical protein